MACHTAGFSSAVRGVTDSYFGNGTGDVILDNVRCTGNEGTFFECTNANRWGVVSARCADHSNDVGVVCSDGKCLG